MKKKKYKKEPLNQDDTKAHGVFFQNYDLYETDGPGPGAGLYSKMDKYKSISDFRKKKRAESMRKRRKSMFEAILVTAKDNNNLTDPTEETITPIPFNPAEPAPLGLIDNMYPKEDLEEKPVTNLYYGRLETHFTKDKNN